MTGRKLTTILLVSFLILNTLGVTTWIHVRTHDHASQPLQSKCTICQLLVTAGQDKAVMEAPLFVSCGRLVATMTPVAAVASSPPVILCLYRRGPPFCA